ncbi:MAG: SHOCT domain-containing protein [Clostridia bacterium]|nr:SHOCT domain-containing protein [Clostridia bacterium]
MEKHSDKKKKPFYKRWWFIVLSIIIAFPIVIFEIACIIVIPPILLLQIFLGITIYYFIRSMKKQKKEKEEEKQKELNLYRQEYKKICQGFFVNDKEHKLNILGTEYGFSQIIDCELIEDGTSISQTFGKAELKYTTTQVKICTKLFVNITTNDFENPRIIFDCKYGRNIQKNSKAYKEALNNAQNIISVLKIVISQNNEKYIETGTVTKIEHRYISEETVQDQIKKLSELYKDGVLTEYEYSIKKQELLEKIK